MKLLAYICLCLWLGNAAAINVGEPPLPARDAPATAASANASATPKEATAGSSAPAPAPAPPANKDINTAPTAMPQLGNANSNPVGLLQVFLSLSLVLAVLIGCAWALKRFGPQQITGGANLRIVGGLSLGGRERVVVLEVGEHWIVVGAAPGQVSALATLPKQDSMPDMSDTKLNPNFATWLKQMMEKRHGD